MYFGHFKLFQSVGRAVALAPVLASALASYLLLKFGCFLCDGLSEMDRTSFFFLASLGNTTLLEGVYS